VGEEHFASLENVSVFWKAFDVPAGLETTPREWAWSRASAEVDADLADLTVAQLSLSGRGGRGSNRRPAR